MIYLRQSTASQEVLLGPFVDSTDGNTAETGLTIANTDIKLWLSGATTLANKNSGGATHISAGNYYAVLDATDTATVGSGAIVVQVSGALAVRHSFTVLPAVVYDALIAGSDLSLFGITAFGTAQAATGTTLQLASATTFANSEVNGSTILVSGGSTGVGQARVITGYVGSTDTATVDTWTTTPTGTITYKVFATAPASGNANANVTQWNGSNVASPATAGYPAVTLKVGTGTGEVNLSSGGVPVASIANNAITANSIASDAITAAKIAADAIGASELAADAVTEIQSGLSTLNAAGVRSAVGLASANLDTQLSTIDDFLDTEVAAIKAKTDQLTFGVTNTVNANITSVNEVAVNGSGAPGDEWGP